MAWSVVYFGNKEIKGKTLPQIVFSDPDWFFWAVQEGIFADKGNLTKEADEINYKARNIKIPQEQGREKLSAIYFLHPLTHDFDHILLSNHSYDKDKAFIIKDTIDLSVPFEINCYHTTGSEIIIKVLKDIYFKDKAPIQTSYEEFFDNNDNFLPSNTS